MNKSETKEAEKAFEVFRQKQDKLISEYQNGERSFVPYSSDYVFKAGYKAKNDKLRKAIVQTEEIRDKVIKNKEADENIALKQQLEELKRENKLLRKIQKLPKNIGVTGG